MTREKTEVFLDSVMHGRRGDVTRLLGEGVDVNARANEDNTALHFAANNGHVDITKDLLDRDAKVDVINDSGETPLHWAVQKAHLEIARTLLRKKTSYLETQDKDGNTPLLTAVSHGNLKIAKFLIGRGADIAAKDKEGKTILHHIVENYCTREDVDRLLGNNSVLDKVQDKGGRTPLDRAVEMKNTNLQAFFTAKGMTQSFE
jgi:ankyrin repeat protein